MAHKSPEAHEAYKAYQREYGRRNHDKLAAYDKRRNATPERRAQLAATQARWRAANPEKARASVTRCHDANRLALARLKDAPCVDCGVRYAPSAMDFDHVRDVKKFGIVGHTMGRPDLSDELAKCELRCSNCHRLRHNPVDPMEDSRAADSPQPF